MEKRTLGNTDLKTAPIVFGGNVFGWTLNEEESFAMLDRVLELGINVIDTADVYSRWVDGNDGGESERIIGRWLKARNNRDKVTIITKVGSDMGQGGIDNSAGYIEKAVERSLDRLQIDTIDLYLTHFDDEKTPVEETMAAYDKLVKAGKVRFVGASNMSAERLTASLEASKKNGFPRYEVFQPEYHLLERKAFETGVGPVCERENLGVITYFSLAAGFLTGKYRSKEDLEGSSRSGMVEKYLDDRGLSVLAAVDRVAKSQGISQAGVALAWLINKPGVTAPIASATKAHHLDCFKEALSANLTQDEMDMLDFASGKVHTPA